MTPKVFLLITKKLEPNQLAAKKKMCASEVKTKKYAALQIKMSVYLKAFTLITLRLKPKMSESKLQPMSIEDQLVSIQSSCQFACLETTILKKLLNSRYQLWYYEKLDFKANINASEIRLMLLF